MSGFFKKPEISEIEPILLSPIRFTRHGSNQCFRIPNQSYQR